MTKFLFVCIHNSARSQMAEAFANLFGKGKVIAESAGPEKGRLNPIVIKVMAEIGIDISNNETNTVESFISEGRKFDYLITNQRRAIPDLSGSYSCYKKSTN